MSLDGDFAALRRLITELSTISRGTMAEATTAARQGVDQQYASDFSGRRDPWGEPWEPTATGKPATLGPLSGARATGANGMVKIRPLRWWVFHQIGANNMKRRAVLPFSPSLWDRPIQALIERGVLRRLERLRG